MPTIIPKRPESKLLQSFFCPTLLSTPGYHIDEPDVRFRLDRNESPFDWPETSKQRILQRVGQHNWNRYPHPFDEELTSLIATYSDVPSSCVLVGPGSNFLLSLCLNAFNQARKGKLVIAQPSFPLYESHCRYSGIPYETWKLNADFQYDTRDLPALSAGSLVIFASPNNPTGNVLPLAKLEALLQAHPDCYFLADEAYYEFAEEIYTPLLARYANLLLIRTFSKALSSAALRLGYLLASAETLQEIRKLMVPYLIAPLTHEAIKEALTHEEMREFIQTCQQTIRKERNSLFQFFTQELPNKPFEAWNSQANFLLLRWQTPEQTQFWYDRFIHSGILLRNVSKGPGLARCLRLTIGNQSDNVHVKQTFCKILREI